VIHAAAQVEHVAAFVVVLYVDPATQAVHPVLAVVVHVVVRRVPAAHMVQAVHSGAFVVVLKLDPAIQALHTLFVVTVQAVDA
jgi:hypothetical protein